MADNYSDSNTSNSDESADEGPSNPIAEAKRLGANLRTPEKAKIAREWKLQINPAGNKSRYRLFVDQVKWKEPLILSLDFTNKVLIKINAMCEF